MIENDSMAVQLKSASCTMVALTLIKLIETFQQLYV